MNGKNVPKCPISCGSDDEGSFRRCNLPDIPLIKLWHDWYHVLSLSLPSECSPFDRTMSSLEVWGSSKAPMDHMGGYYARSSGHDGVNTTMPRRLFARLCRNKATETLRNDLRTAGHGR